KLNKVNAGTRSVCDKRIKKRRNLYDRFAHEHLTNQAKQGSPGYVIEYSAFQISFVPRFIFLRLVFRVRHWKVSSTRGLYRRFACDCVADKIVKRKKLR